MIINLIFEWLSFYLIFSFRYSSHAKWISVAIVILLTCQNYMFFYLVYDIFHLRRSKVPV